MPKYKYVEIGIGEKIDDVPNEHNLWEGYSYMHPFITWNIVKAVARRRLTKKQFYMLILRGEYGLLYREAGESADISLQSAQERIELSIKKLRKIFEKYLKMRVYMRGEFSFHCEIEKKLRSGDYYDRFKEKKCTKLPTLP